MSSDKIAKVSTKSAKKTQPGSKVYGKHVGNRSVPKQGSHATVARMAQEKQAKVIDELARLAIRQHWTALKELERH